VKPQRDVSSAEEPREGSLRPRVLIVDDDLDILKMLKSYLGAKGFDVITTDSPFSVLELLREHTPDVVVLDLMIPGLDGKALSGFVRTHSKAAIVFFTASSSDAIDALRNEDRDVTVVAKGGSLSALGSAISAAIR
jgi:DNA-binding response OmpR family regulator